jgi:EAL domain-containing protein (putative c-di-GMP-specific phosphodiesterase class I)
LSGIPVALNGFAGAVTSPQDGTEYELLLKRARLSARDARKGTRGPISSYRPEIELAAQLKTVLEGELRAALDGNQFTLMLQPKFALATTALVGAEALIRWAHPRRGMLPPKAFLDIAHEVGVMVALDQWVLRQSLRHCTTLMGMGLATPISINLSVESLADMYLAERVADALEDAGVPPQMLEVEIPEGALMQDVQVSAQVLSQLHAMGVRISIDDFGTGYSSFAYLAQFPVHALKIDRQFVTDLETKEVSRKVVKGIIRLAHSLALEVVAEGAETLQQVDLLRKMRCDSVQGYALGKPMPWSEFKKLASGRRDTGDSMMTALSI